MTTILFFLSLEADENEGTYKLKMALRFDLVARYESGRLSAAGLNRFEAAHTGDRTLV